MQHASAAAWAAWMIHSGSSTRLHLSVVEVCSCVLSMSGPLDSKTFPFIVIDEAAQVIEPAVILPLGKGAVQAVMVGDQCQLPATVLSQEAQAKGLDISMFDRSFERKGKPICDDLLSHFRFQL